MEKASSLEQFFCIYIKCLCLSKCHSGLTLIYCEFAEHEAISKGLEASVYFAHPYASWERAINENTNRLIRQYFPKGTDFTKVTDEQVQFVMDRLNNRPRETRGGCSPNELFMGRRYDLLAA